MDGEGGGGGENREGWQMERRNVKNANKSTLGKGSTIIAMNEGQWSMRDNQQSTKNKINKNII